MSYDRTVPLGWLDVQGRTCDGLVSIELTEQRTHYSVRVVLVRNGKAERSTTRKLVSSRAEIAEYVDARLKVLARRVKREFDREAGAVFYESTDKDTGRLRQLAHADDKDAGKYEVICAEHATLVGVDTLAQAKSTSLRDFCEDCRE